MPTTKKVASKKVSAPKNTVVTATVPAAVSSAKKAKSVPKKSILKTTSLPNKNSKLAIKDNTYKKPSVAKKVESQTRIIDSKLQKVEALHSKKPQQKEAKKVTLLSRSLTLKPTVALALLSPYRFPINAEHIALNAARFGGTFFVALGAAFTLFFAHGSFTTGPQVATLIETTQTTIQNTNTTINCADPLQFTSTTCASVVDQSPSVQFDVNTSSGVITEPTRVQVKVQNAQKVSLNAYYKTLTQELRLGTMSKVSNDTWEFFWNTTSFEDGEYKLKVMVTNAYGTYEALDTRYVTLETPVETTSDTSDESTTQSDTTGTDITNEVDEPPVEISLTDDVTDETTPVEDTVEPVVEEPVLKPEAIITLQSGSPLKGVVGVRIDVEFAALIEMYVQNRSSLTKKFLGMASIFDRDTWNYRFDTTQIPNGEYRLIAVIKNRYGSYETVSPYTKVFNEALTAYTPKQEEQIRILSEIGTEVEEPDLTYEVQEESPEYEDEEVPERMTLTLPQELEDTPEDEVMESETQPLFKDAISQFQKEVEAQLQRFAIALRSKDTKAIEEARASLQKLKSAIIQSQATGSQTDDLVEKLDEYIQLAVTKIEENVIRTEKLIAERTPEKADADSDKDGIADYDEVALYKTNPFSADSDNDGFMDGAEILSGYDPTDAASESLVDYESPQENGVVREDILEVTSISTAEKNDESEANNPPVAIISGKGLPNSFVTLYIFSTPLVITLKTEADGSWNYRFDKELENGAHEVYVGVTDNSGKIVAKSKPFAFIKEAQAFTPASALSEVPQAPVVVENKSLLSTYMVYLVLSISVVAIGLVLILLGLHLDTRQRKYGVGDSPVEATV